MNKLAQIVSQQTGASPKKPKSRISEGFNPLGLPGRAMNPVSWYMASQAPGKGSFVNSMLGRISPETRKRVEAELQNDPELKDVSVQLGHVGLLDALQNIRKLPDTPVISKILRAVLTVPSSIARNLSGVGDHYDPIAHTVHLYTDNPAVAFHELGHAKDLGGGAGRIGLRAAVAHVGLDPALNLYDEAQANILASKKLKDTEQSQIGKTLMPAYGSYVGAGVGALLAALQAYKGQAVDPRLAVSPIVGMSLGGLAGSVYNRAKGHTDTKESLQDALKASLLGGAAVPLARMLTKKE